MKKTASLITGEIIARIRAVGIKAKKHLGQNFLINAGIYQKIFGTLSPSIAETIIEIGPGLGTLTDYLVTSGAEVIAIEKDWHLTRYLGERYRGKKNVKIIGADVLGYNPRENKIEPRTYKVVGNIPYYLTSNLIRLIFEKWPQPKVIVFLVQKEVAQRITASPPDMSLLSVSVQYYAKPEIIAPVARGSFYPPPKVDSAIIKLTPKASRRHLEAKDFFQTVRAGFSAKRKQLANNLANEFRQDKARVEEKLNSIGINPKRRAETITLEEWQKITNIF